MFAQKNRLKKDVDIKRVVKDGKSVFDSVCRVRYLQNRLPESRFLVVVGLKISKSAVVRNRIRRQYQEIVRLNQTFIRPGYDIVFLCSKSAMTADYHEKNSRLLGVLKKARLLC